jgi:hypothetical protein
MPQIQEDCYYYIERVDGVPASEWKIRAMCKECGAKVAEKKRLMKWKGSALGYNKDYDLYCTIPGCNKPIFLREQAEQSSEKT